MWFLNNSMTRRAPWGPQDDGGIRRLRSAFWMIERRAGRAAGPGDSPHGGAERQGGRQGRVALRSQVHHERRSTARWAHRERALLKTAAQAGVVSTGNGQRGLFSQPSPTLTKLVIGAGETPLAELIGSIRSWLLIYEVLGLGQGNTSSGAFSNLVSPGYRIESGEIVGRVATQVRVSKQEE